MRLTCRLGFWSAAFGTMLGVTYFAGMLGAFVSGSFVMPPPEPVQLLGGVITLVIAPVLIVLMACVHRVSPAEKQILSELGLVFTALFAAMVSINRFVQFAVVRQSVLSGNTEGLDRFLPYDPGSAILALEMLGWGLFLGLAMLAVAPVFAEGRLELAIRWLAVIYGVLGVSSSVAYMVGSPISAIGFVAWGLVLYLVSGLLMIFFKRAERPQAVVSISSR